MTDLIDQLTDVTLSDTPIEDFAVQVLAEIIGLGRFGILVDMPDDADPKEIRPYWVGYRTEQITNWRETTANGDTYPTLIVLKEQYEIEINEFELKKDDQYRVLQLVPDTRVPATEGGNAYVQRIYRKASEQAKEFTQFGPDIVPVNKGVPLSFIPFQTFGPVTLGLCPDKPPLSEMAETNLHMYRRSADLEHGRHFTGLPQPVVIGLQPPPPGAQAKPLTIGSSEAWTLPLGADAKYLEFTGQGLSALVEGMKEDKEEMAELGSEMFAPEPDSATVETATAVKVRHSGKTASLKTIARRLGSGLSNCLQWHAWWLGLTETPDDDTILAKVNTVFLDLKMTPDELKAWVLALQAGSVSYPTFYAQLEKGELTRPGVDAEQEKAEIDSEASLAATQAADAAQVMAEAVPPAPTPAGSFAGP